MVGSASDGFGKKPIYTNVSKKEKKILLRNHGSHMTVKLLGVTLEEETRLYKKFGGDIFKKDLYEKERLYKKKLKSANVMHRVELKKNCVF